MHQVHRRGGEQVLVGAWFVSVLSVFYGIALVWTTACLPCSMEVWLDRWGSFGANVVLCSSRRVDIYLLIGC